MLGRSAPLRRSPSASAASFFCRLTNGLTYAGGISRTVCPSRASSSAPNDKALPPHAPPSPLPGTAAGAAKKLNTWVRATASCGKQLRPEAHPPQVRLKAMFLAISKPIVLIVSHGRLPRVKDRHLHSGTHARPSGGVHSHHPKRSGKSAGRSRGRRPFSAPNERKPHLSWQCGELFLQSFQFWSCARHQQQSDLGVISGDQSVSTGSVGKCSSSSTLSGEMCSGKSMHSRVFICPSIICQTPRP